MRLTASNIVKAINGLPKDRWYEYIDPKNRGKIKVVSVTLPEGPISIQRSTKNKTESISANMIWRLANAMGEGVPINVDRVFGGSYNTRSVLESLIAHTPEFYWCQPGRIELNNSTQKIKKGHKHIVWRPTELHGNALLSKFETDIVISEIPNTSAVYDPLHIPSLLNQGIHNIDVQRRHLQIQIALAVIGNQLGFRTWIARNDQGITYGNKKVGEIDGVVADLQNEKLITVVDGAVKAAMHIDCIWFRNGKFLPAVIEVEHSTGVTSGLTRMKGLYDQLPRFPTRWVIVAPDEDRNKVITEANKPQFKDLKTMFFPYSAVDELYALCQKRKLSNIAVNEEFLDCYMEPCLPSLAHH